MLRVLRISLMWLIALAVPIQGSAAVTMFGCGPGHHGGVGSSQMSMADEHAQDGDDHSHATMAEAAESHHHDGGVPHDHSDSQVHGTVHKVATKGNCTPCASCCVVAALPAAVIQFEHVPLANFFVLSAQGSVSSFLADGLERPPRLSLD